MALLCRDLDPYYTPVVSYIILRYSAMDTQGLAVEKKISVPGNYAVIYKELLGSGTSGVVLLVKITNPAQTRSLQDNQKKTYVR